ncbi:NUDIX hydrolase [Cellulomonas sp. PhB143]|uniref:NUDIX hydrolase n=1 Tax=Cellulomonas sp. PhB143 TaxID=2485186 RepID=UPI000F49754A|nr:NUDIX domain-containing protein [Cellulomonas sp. PhB143]ROS74586.1 ADP-ribose pyrophosphatase YjhB (NUDIX family) [Cellulomonas sp. PhB143]
MTQGSEQVPGTRPGPEAGPGPDWVRGADGLLFRRAARVILLDPDDRVLLVRGHDVDQPARSWWFTVGGGIDAGESAREAALREVREETGIVLADDALVGPVVRRSAIFDFFAAHCRQDEVIFLARVDAAAAAALNRDGWTDGERDVLDELAWWDLAALAAVDIEVFPVGLAELVRGLVGGWDGVVVELGLARE